MNSCLLCRQYRRGRGLCAQHYRDADKLVKAGVTTWAALEQAGKALPPATNQGKTPWWARRKGGT